MLPWYSCSFFIPLEQGLKLRTRLGLVLHLRSFFIPLEQGLKLNKYVPVFGIHGRSFFIPLEQGLKQVIASQAEAVNWFFLHSIRTRIKNCKALYNHQPKAGSFFIPLEQGLKLALRVELACESACSFFIPLEQGLKPLLLPHQPRLVIVLSSFH